MFDKFVERCKELGRDTTTDLTGDELSKKLAKVIVTESIMDDDAFELGEKYYREGRASTTVEAEEGI